MTPATNRPVMVPVVYGDRCIGFIFKRRGAFEVFDIDERSLGTFVDERTAVAALFNKPARCAP